MLDIKENVGKVTPYFQKGLNVVKLCFDVLTGISFVLFYCRRVCILWEEINKGEAVDIAKGDMVSWGVYCSVTSLEILVYTYIGYHLMKSLFHIKQIKYHIFDFLLVWGFPLFVWFGLILYSAIK